jgi:hypothetical protein
LAIFTVDGSPVGIDFYYFLVHTIAHAAPVVSLRLLNDGSLAQNKNR